MKNWYVKLIRKIGNDFLTVIDGQVQEFNDECLDINLYYDALDLFENIIEDNDIVVTYGNKEIWTQYDIATGTGIVL